MPVCPNKPVFCPVLFVVPEVVAPVVPEVVSVVPVVAVVPVPAFVPLVAVVLPGDAVVLAPAAAVAGFCCPEVPPKFILKSPDCAPACGLFDCPRSCAGVPTPPAGESN